MSDSETPWTVAHQTPPFMGFSRQEYGSGLPFPSPGDLPDPGIEPGSPTLQADHLTSEPHHTHILFCEIFLLSQCHIFNLQDLNYFFFPLPARVSSSFSSFFTCLTFFSLCLFFFAALPKFLMAFFLYIIETLRNIYSELFSVALSCYFISNILTSLKGG